MLMFDIDNIREGVVKYGHKDDGKMTEFDRV